jgi:putative tricarboxylic transport membrane protein
LNKPQCEKEVNNVNHDITSSLFLLVFGTFVLIGSIQLGLGSAREPGPGFISFGASGLLTILALIGFLKATSKKDGKMKNIFAGTLWWRVVFSGLAILAYVWLMPILGYLIATFFLMVFLYWLVRGQRWWETVIASFLTTLVTYCLFSKLLNSQFPSGLFTF